MLVHVYNSLSNTVQILQAQLKLAENLRKMAEQGKDVEGMDIDLDELRAKVSPNLCCDSTSQIQICNSKFQLI